MVELEVMRVRVHSVELYRVAYVELRRVVADGGGAGAPASRS